MTNTFLGIVFSYLFITTINQEIPVVYDMNCKSLSCGAQQVKLTLGCVFHAGEAAWYHPCRTIMSKMDIDKT
jgi:hypothetical protein